MRKDFNVPSLIQQPYVSVVALKEHVKPDSVFFFLVLIAYGAGLDRLLCIGVLIFSFHFHFILG